MTTSEAQALTLARRLHPDGIHTCSYSCDQPACIRAQRDELVARLNEPFGNSGQLPPAGEAVEMSPEFTDTARAALAWVLWHHQGGSSPVGQPIRFALGMGAHDPLPDWRITEAVRYANLFGWTTDDFHRTTPPAAQTTDLTGGWDAAAFASLRDAVNEWKERALDAEATIQRLTDEFNAANGPTHMGEAVLPSAQDVVADRLEPAVGQGKAP